MTTSSAQPDCSITSSDTITSINPVQYKWGGSSVTLNTGFIAQDVSDLYTTTLYNGGGVSGTIGNITISNGGSYYSAGSTITTSSGAGTTFTIPDTIYSIGEEFVHRMPDIHRINEMCKEYPGLKIAFEKFKNTYRLVKDDYDNPNKEKP